jgi:Nif-specific regulatory protein
MNARLIVLTGKHAGITIPMGNAAEHVIGREPDSTVTLDDPACSRRHARLWQDASGWQVADLSSANGTHVNGQRIEQAQLHDGDKLLVGGTWLRFVEVDAPGAASTGAPATWILEDSVNPESSLTAISGRSTPAARAELDSLERVASAIARHTDPHELAAEVLRIVVDHLEAAGARLLLTTGRQAFAEYAPAPMPPIGDDLVGQAMSTAEAVLVPMRDGPLRVRSIFAPLKYLGRTEGVLWVAEQRRGKPFTHEDLCLVASIAHVLAPPFNMLRNVRRLERRQDGLTALRHSRVVARSAEMQTVLQLVARVADLDNTVLLRGESGVGKEVVACLIHETGRRREQPMVCVNCAALTESLLESELFGHEKGAFTGASHRRLGKFELADDGTIFLDELGSMSLTTQAKVLRVLDGHPFERVGGHVPIRCNVRVIAATNADLESMVREGSFRNDLYHRLKVIEIRIPPLRERPADIPELAEQFLRDFVDKTGRSLAFQPEALEVLAGLEWPGNVRQLRNLVEQAAILSTDDTLTSQEVALLISGSVGSDEVLPLDQITRSGIERALAGSPNVPEAARKLGLSRSALYRHMKKHGIEPPRRTKA